MITKKINLFYIITFIALLSIVFLFSTTIIAAEDLEVEVVPIYDVVAMEEVNIPAKYVLTVKNSYSYDETCRIYTLLEADIQPEDSFSVLAGDEKSIDVSLLLLAPLKETCGEGRCSVHYYFKGETTGIFEKGFLVDVLPLERIINIKVPISITREDSLLIFNISNKKNIDLGEVKFTFNSDFATTEKDLTLAPNASYKVELDLDPGELKTLKAGDYEVEFKFFINNEYEHIVKKIITLEEFTNIETTELTKFKFFGFTKTITKKNAGNTPKFITIEVIKNKFEHAFTSSDITPTSEKSSGAVMIMRWQRELEPGESLSVDIYTDYTIPTIILILIIIVAVTIYLIRRPRVLVKKKAFRIKAKGAEFALKIVLLVKNVGQDIKSVKCMDRLPRIVKIYEKFGAIKPHRIEKDSLAWNFGDLMPGEEKIVSYIVYSKVLPVGTITIPQAVVKYTDMKDRRKTSLSNRLLVMGESVE